MALVAPTSLSRAGGLRRRAFRFPLRFLGFAWMEASRYFEDQLTKLYVEMFGSSYGDLHERFSFGTQAAGFS